MENFDYASAWYEIAKPAFDALPPEIHALYSRVTTECEGLGQLANLAMPWPETDLRAAFENVSDEDLAFAAHVINSYGHWRPGSAPREGRNHGQHWKFSHYADQILRLRLGWPYEHDPNKEATGVSFKVIEGLLRVCISTKDSWQWEEVAPATQALYAGLKAEPRPAMPLKRDNAETRARLEERAYEWMKALAARYRETLPEPWQPWFGVAERYMRSDEEAKRLEWARVPQERKDAAKVKARSDFEHDYQTKLSNLKVEHDGYSWLMDRDEPTDNAIYYKHTGRWCFGWRTPLTKPERRRLLDILAEFPFDYDLKGGE